MKTDSLFYLLFQTAPAIFFELIDQAGAASVGYRFSSVELKQTAFRVDGVFLPPPGATDQPVYFVEVQFQKDERLYRRLFAEIFLFLQQHPEISQWRAVVIYPKASLEAGDQSAYESLLVSGQCQRVYLEGLASTPSAGLGVGLVRLVVEPARDTATLARRLMTQAQTQGLSVLSQEQIIELIETIVVYKFPQLSREEIAAMLGISELRQTRVFQEFYDEGRQQGLQEGQRQGLQEGRQVGLQEGRQVGLQEGRQVGLQEGRQVGLQEGRQAESLALVLRLLRRRLGTLPEALQTELPKLSVVQLEELGEALLDFEGLVDLEDWLHQLRQMQEQVTEPIIERLNPVSEAWEPTVRAQLQELGLSQLAALMETAAGFTAMADLVEWLKGQTEVTAHPENRGIEEI